MAKNRRRSSTPVFEEPQDPAAFEHLRSSLPGQPVAGIQPDVLGYGRYGNMEKEDTVVLGHPEAAGQYMTKYNARDQFLGDMDDAPTERQDLNYVGPEEIRRRSKGSSFGW